MRRQQAFPLLYLCLLLPFGNYAFGVPASDVHTNLFFCLSSKELNYSSFDTPSFYKIFDLSAYNLRVTKSLRSKPVAIILPETKEQLATAIFCCKKQSSVFTIRSGGHSFEGLSYSSGDHEFVMIDLMNLNRVSVDLESKTAWVEAGATLGEMYYAIGRSSNLLGFPAGLCPAVGSGGHIAGGGYGLMSRKYGLASDNVVDAILVDANGRLLNRETMGEDVFWAIRGGGGGTWAAIYAWKIQLVHVPNFVTAFRIMRHGSVREVAELLHTWQVVAPNLGDEFGLMCSVSVESATRVLLTFQGLYLGPKMSALDSLFYAYPELKLVDTECKEMRWVESMAYFPGIAESFTVDTLNDRFALSNQKFFYKWKGDYVKELISLEGIQGTLEKLLEEPRGQLELSPLGGMMARTRSDAFPCPHREGNLYSIGYLVAWGEDDDEKSDVYMNWIREIYKYMAPFVSKGPRAAYVNELDLDLGIMDWENANISSSEFFELGKAWGEKYFLGNYERLVRAKTLIDPDNVFRHKQSIPPSSFGDSDDEMNDLISC